MDRIGYIHVCGQISFRLDRFKDIPVCCFELDYQLHSALDFCHNPNSHLKTKNPAMSMSIGEMAETRPGAA